MILGNVDYGESLVYYTKCNDLNIHIILRPLYTWSRYVCDLAEVFATCSKCLSDVARDFVFVVNMFYAIYNNAVIMLTTLS